MRSHSTTRNDQTANHALVDYIDDTAHGLAVAGKLLAEVNRPSGLDLLREAVGRQATAETLTAFCRGALALYDLNALNEAVSAAETMGKGDPKLMAQVADIRAGPLKIAALCARLYERQSVSIAPVTGRVLYILHKSLPDSCDGYAMRSHGMATALKMLGADVVCMTRPGFPFDLSLDHNPGRDVTMVETVGDVSYHRLANPTRDAYPRAPYEHMAHASLGYLEAAAKQIGEAIRQHRPAYVMAASNHTTALPACLAAHSAGLPFVYEVRGFWEITHASRSPAYAMTTTGRQERFLEVETARAADAVLTLTPPMLEELVSRGVPRERIFLVPNACDPERFQPVSRDPTLAYSLGLPPDLPVIGYAGSFTQYEGLDDLVSACASLRQRGLIFRVLLIGSEAQDATGALPITARIKQIAAEGGLEDWLILTGRVPHDKVAAHYSLIDIAPFARKSQPVTELVSPLKPLEALSMGKAIIVSSVGGMQGMVQEGKTGLIFDKNDNEALTRALERLLKNPEERDAIGAAGRAWVLANRSWRHVAESALEALRTTNLG